MAKALSPRETHGPVVESGPTRGQNRSRNKDGRWRKKRSDAGMSRNLSDDILAILDRIGEMYD